MRFSFGITARLFAAFLLTNIVTAVAVGYGVRAAFDSGFEAYVKEREEQRLTRLSGVVANAYREAGSWDFLRGNESLWLQLNHTARGEPGGRPPHFGPPPRGGEPGKGPPPDWANAKMPPPRGPDRPPRSVVLDESGTTVVGESFPGEELARRPVTVDGKRVGWIASPVREGAFDFADRRFREEQWKSTWVVALVALALSAIVAGFLARGLLSPVKRIAAATRKLADGDYTTRVAPTSTDELGQLVDDFNRLGNALDKQEAARRNFMADVSHELRTPIAVLRGELEALQDGVRAASPETIASLKAEVSRLAKLVDDIHDLSLADVGGLAYRFESVDVARVVSDALLLAAPRLQARGLQATFDRRASGAALVVRGDRRRLEQVAANLLENTLRYTDEGGQLVVSLRTEGREAVVDWSDSAPGVPADALPRLFDRLFRVEVSRNRERGGSGLGLAIVKGIVEAHGGTVAAHASDFGGLRIELRFPLGEPA